MFYKQVVAHRGIPFDITPPVREFGDLTKAERDAILSTGWDDVRQGRVRPAKDIHGDLRRLTDS